jgi:hypothetical protein
MAADPLASITEVYPVAREIGPTSINNTVKRWDVQGADLGSMFDLNGKLYMVFGDTFGPPPPAGGGGGGSDWRSNTMAVIKNWHDPASGLPFASMITNRPGHAKALIQGLHQPNNGKGEVTKIPTNGIGTHLGPRHDRMFLDFMSVKQWGQPGHWSLNYSAIAYSDDLGKNWTISDVSWPGDSNFGQVAIVRVGSETDPAKSMLYFFGIPGGRFGSVELARVPETQILDQSAYQYYTGSPDGEPVWSSDAAAAVPIVPAPVAELSVMWDAYLDSWIMITGNANENDLVMLDSPTLWGPWSSEHVLISGQQNPGAYGGYMSPLLTENNGQDIYFTVSEWGPYAVFLYHAQLNEAAPVPPTPIHQPGQPMPV